MDWKLQFISEEEFTGYVADNVELVDNIMNDIRVLCDKVHFHRGIFQYIAHCQVSGYEEAGRWDVIFKKDSGIVLPDGDVVHKVLA